MGNIFIVSPSTAAVTDVIIVLVAGICQVFSSAVYLTLIQGGALKCSSASKQGTIF